MYIILQKTWNINLFSVQMNYAPRIHRNWMSLCEMCLQFAIQYGYSPYICSQYCPQPNFRKPTYTVKTYWKKDRWIFNINKFQQWLIQFDWIVCLLYQQFLTVYEIFIKKMQRHFFLFLKNMKDVLFITCLHN